MLDLAAEKAGWGTPLPENHGRGIAIHRSFGTIVAQVVEVEVTDGRVWPRRAICAVDAGFAMHPDGMKAQMESGIVYGLTAAMYSNITIHRGAVAQSNFHDYPMLRMNESPDIETYIVNSGERIGARRAQRLRSWLGLGRRRRTGNPGYRTGTDQRDLRRDRHSHPRTADQPARPDQRGPRVERRRLSDVSTRQSVRLVTSSRW